MICKLFCEARRSFSNRQNFFNDLSIVSGRRYFRLFRMSINMSETIQISSLIDFSLFVKFLSDFTLKSTQFLGNDSQFGRDSLFFA